MIPNGKYRARATGGQWGQSKKKGTIMCRVSFSITEDEHAGATAIWDGYFADNTKARAVDSLRHCGCTFPNDNVTDLTGIDKQEVEIVVEVEEYTANDGEVRHRSRVQWVNALGGLPEDQQLDEAGKAAFAAQMKGLLVASRKKSSPNGSAPARREESGEVPFTNQF